MMDWGNYLKIGVLKISMYEFVDRDGPLDEPIPESLFTGIMKIKPRHYFVC